MIPIHGRIALTALLVAFGAAGPEVAAAKTTHPYSSTATSAPISTANGYPAPGGVAVLAGTLKSTLGDGAFVDHVTITGQPAPDVISFRGSEVDYFAEGTVRNTFTGTVTVQPDGSQKVAATGILTGGTARYRGATGRFAFTGATASGSSVITGHGRGSISY
jgi:hypothetical protein